MGLASQRTLGMAIEPKDAAAKVMGKDAEPKATKASAVSR